MAWVDRHENFGHGPFPPGSQATMSWNQAMRKLFIPCGPCYHFLSRRQRSEIWNAARGRRVAFFGKS